MYQLIKKKKHEDKLFKDAKKGAIFKKHGRKGKPHERFISVSKELDTISWKEVGGGGKVPAKNIKNQIVISDFKSIQKGADTKVFKRTKNVKPEFCLSLVGDERTLDLECSSQDMRDTWYEILECVLQRSISMKMDSKKFLSQEADVDRVTKVLAKFTFDIQSDTWKVSKLLTKNANFQENEFSHLALALEQNPIVRILDLSSIKLSDVAVTNLCKGLDNARALTYLSLADNEVTSEGVAELSKLFKNRSTQIRILDLSNNSIADDGMEVLADSLHHNTTLEELNLDGNMIGDLGCEALIEMFNTNKTLKKLRMSDNALQNDAISHICQCLKNPDTPLEFLTLSRNQVVFPEPRRPYDEYGEGDGNETEEEHDHSLEINLFLAVDSSDYGETVLLLLKGADPNVQNEEDGKTPLHIAALRGDMVMLEFLISHPHIDLNAMDDNSTTPIHNAIQNSQYDVVKLLLEKGADLRVPDAHRKTCLHIASEQGNKAMCKLLIETYKGDINVTTDQEWTPLHYAAAGLHKDVTQYLLEMASKQLQDDLDTDSLRYVNWQDINGETALHKALSGTGSKNDMLEVSKELVKNGADVSLEDNQGRTPLHDAPEDIRKILLNETRLCAAKRRP